MAQPTACVPARASLALAGDSRHRGVPLRCVSRAEGGEPGAQAFAAGCTKAAKRMIEATEVPEAGRAAPAAARALKIEPDDFAPRQHAGVAEVKVTVNEAGPV